MATALKQRRAG